MALAYLFPGQGSQSTGMGGELFDAFPGLVASADAVLGYSVRQLCLDGGTRLRETRYAQPALFVVNAMAYLRRAERHGAPEFLAGHSLGEYSALFAAGSVDFETGLRLVARRGELMGTCTGGRMMAVLGVPLRRLTSIIARAGIDGIDGIDVANHNAPDQLVLAGPAEATRALSDLITDAGLGKCVPLNVSVAAHSRYMEPAVPAFTEELRSVRFAEPRIPVLANVTATPYRADTATDLLTRHLTSPVRWWDTLCALSAAGVDRIEEVGPGEVLTRMWQKAAPHLPAARPTAADQPAPAPVPAAGSPVPAAGSPAPAVRSPVPAPVSAPAAGSPVLVPAVAAGSPASPAVAVATTLRAGTEPAVASESLGDDEFRRAYRLRHAYLVGAMGHGVSGPRMLRRLADAGLFGFLGTAGQSLPEVERDLGELADLPGRYGVSLPVGLVPPAHLAALVSLAVRQHVRHAEVAGYPGVTEALVRWRFLGAHRGPDGGYSSPRLLLAKVSRLERAEAFLRPAPPELVARLRAAGELTAEEAAAATRLPVATDVCVEADSGWLAGGGGGALLPAVLALRDEAAARYRYPAPVRVGASGGIGSPEAVAAAFLLGAGFVLTGSVNQCSPEARTSAAVKELLHTVDLDDTAYAPAGELFTLGGRSQVVARRGTLFAARAATLLQLYRTCSGLADLDPCTRRSLERDYFGCPLDEVLRAAGPGRRDPKRDLARVFGQYFTRAARAARDGVPDQRLNYQIPCGPAMGAFNRSVAGTPLAEPARRHVDAVAEHLMSGAGVLLSSRLRQLAAR